MPLLSSLFEPAVILLESLYLTFSLCCRDLYDLVVLLQVSTHADIQSCTVDAYRNKMRSTMMADGQEATQIAPHFETRVGKRRWLERTRRSGRPTTP